MAFSQSAAPLALYAIGVVRSPLVDRTDAPRQGREGAPDAWLELADDLRDALDGIGRGDDIIVLTWLHGADRDTLKVHPRNDLSRLCGVFATRSPDRPNPIGLHRVTVREVDGTRLLVGPIEAIDGTPVVDIKAVLSHTDDA
jgi:tRNA-Thr(GGU) m(6)t(6)A37 methyltransferase TsaA